MALTLALRSSFIWSRAGCILAPPSSKLGVFSLVWLLLVEALGGESGTLISSMPLLLEVERRRRGDLDRRRRFDRLSFFERREDRERDRRFDRFLWLCRERDRDLFRDSFFLFRRLRSSSLESEPEDCMTTGAARVGMTS